MTKRINTAAAVRGVNLGARVPVAGEAAAAAARAEQRSKKPVEPFYGSAAWKALMREIIRERGRRCEDPRCETSNRGQGGKVYGDHMVELIDGGAALDKANVLLRCARCHGRKTAEARRAREGGGVSHHKAGRAPPPQGYFP